MSERGTTALLALGALLLFFVLMFGGRAGGAVGEAPRPTSVESSANGYSIARRWLEAQGVRVVSIRERFGELPRLAPVGPGRESLLVLTLPGTGPIQTRELAPLDRWLRAGNTLLVVAALGDAPDWARGAAGADAFDLKAVTGLEFEPLDGGARRRGRGPGALLSAPRRVSARALGGMALLDGVATLAGESDYRRSDWAVQLPFDGIVLELARDAVSGAGVLWSRPIGRGRIVVAGYGSSFTNRAIGLADNGRLLANLVAGAVGPEGAVLFDDGHQGLAPTYDPAQLFGDRRLHVTIGTLLSLWLVWVLGATRLRTPRAAEAAPRPGELLRAAGGFFARVLPRATAALRLCEHFFARLPGARDAVRPVDAMPPWDWLARHPGIDPADLRQLRAWHANALQGRPVPLGNLHNLLRRMEKGLA